MEEEFTIKELLLENTRCLALGIWEFYSGGYLTIYHNIEDIKSVLAFDTDTSNFGDFCMAVDAKIPVYCLPQAQGGKIININE